MDRELGLVACLGAAAVVAAVGCSDDTSDSGEPGDPARRRGEGSPPCATCGDSDDTPPSEAADGCAVRPETGDPTWPVFFAAIAIARWRRRRVRRAASSPTLRR